MLKGTINIIGVIGDFGKEKGVNLLDVIKQVKQQPEATQFEVIINSVGGDVYVGLEIFDYLFKLNLTHPLTMIGKGNVASIATVLFFAGTYRFLEKDCEFMIHQPWVIEASGTVEDMKNFAKELQEIETFLINFYVEYIGLEVDLITLLVKKETWFTLEECEALGIAKEYVEEQQKQTPVVAMANISNKKYLK